MTPALIDLRLAVPSVPPRLPWAYGVTRDDAHIEVAAWLGNAPPGLDRHFHDEVQVTFVLEGSRVFSVGRTRIEATAGECVAIPAGVSHAALGWGGPSINIYVPPHLVPALAGIAVFGMPRAWLRDRLVPIDELDRALRAAPQAVSMIVRGAVGAVDGRRATLVQAMTGTSGGAMEAARKLGLSREGFLRAFTREVGMTPHAYRIAVRLNAARVALRGGLPPSAAAADAGFADQSHLGRFFRRSFGATPAAYRAALTAR